MDAWGWNGFGQLGIGTTADSDGPWRVGAMHYAVAGSAGAAHTVAAFDLTS